MPQRLTAKLLRQRAEWDVEIEDGFTVRVRRIDIIQAYMQGFIPLPLMAALSRLQQQAANLHADPTGILATDPADRAATIELLQRYACTAIVDPVFVLVEDDNPEHCPISMLSATQLLKIWQSRPGASERVEVTAPVAKDFRERVEPVEPPPPVSDEPKVPPAAVVVSHGDGIAELTYG